MKAGVLLIGDLASRIGVQPEAIRYYERRGLLPKPQRAANGYRVYGQEHLHRVEFIKSAQSLGFSLDEVREVLELKNRQDSTCEHVAELLRTKMDAVDEQIKRLKAFRRDLGKSLRACERTVPSHDADCCPVIERLEAGRKTGRTN